MQSQHRPVDPRRQGRLPARREGQPADAPCRHRKLFRNSADERGRAGRDGWQGPRPHRGPHLYGLPCRRLVRRAALLPGRTPLPATHHHRHGREPHRARRQDRDRTAILYRLPRALGRSLRGRRTRPLGDRKQPSLDPRRDLQRGSVTPARRSRCQKHGRGPPLRPQSGTPSRRQTIHQAPPQARRLGSKKPARYIGANAMLTSTRCPGLSGAIAKVGAPPTTKSQTRKAGDCRPASYLNRNEQPPRHTAALIHCSSFCFCRAPTWREASSPFLKIIRVGIDMIPYLVVVVGFSSMLSLTIFTLPCIEPDSSSSAGGIILQGPPHSAQKSTTTGPEALRTSLSKVASETLSTAITIPIRWPGSARRRCWHRSMDRPCDRQADLTRRC